MPLRHGWEWALCALLAFAAGLFIPLQDASGKVPTDSPSEVLRLNIRYPAPASAAPSPTAAPSFVDVPLPSVTLPTVEDARAYALAIVGTKQFVCLDKLWYRESRWRWWAKNRTSGAYGIPQAYPAAKMASAGEDWLTNPVTQVKWGLGYISGRYGTACDAWAFWLKHHWY
jgi:hypothetical protein